MTGSQRIGKGLFIDDAAAGGVDQHSTRLHGFDGCTVDQHTSIVSQRDMDREEVRLSKYVLKCEQLDAR